MWQAEGREEGAAGQGGCRELRAPRSWVLTGSGQSQPFQGAYGRGSGCRDADSEDCRGQAQLWLHACATCSGGEEAGAAELAPSAACLFDVF